MTSTDHNLDSLIRLLDDRDPFVFNRVRETLISMGDVAIPYLEKATFEENLDLRKRAHEILRSLQPLQLKEKFKALADASGTPDLEQGAYLIMEYGQTGDGTAEEVGEHLDGLAAELRPRLDSGDTPEDTLKKLNRYLFEEQGFHGNQGNFFQPENSYLNSVLKHRTGIPISLSLVCILVGKRLGLPIEGVGLPCHFIAKYDHGEHPLLFDPFNKGRLLTAQSCKDLVEGFGLEYEDKFLATATSRDILVRMLHNLITIFNRTHDEEKSAQLVEFSQILLEPPQ